METLDEISDKLQLETTPDDGRRAWASISAAPRILNRTPSCPSPGWEKPHGARSPLDGDALAGLLGGREGEARRGSRNSCAASARRSIFNPTAKAI